MTKKSIALSALAGIMFSILITIYLIKSFVEFALRIVGAM
jgi:predicted small secreted protein